MPEKSIPTVLTPYPVVVELPIQWGDLDAYGHVNNGIYMKWFEAARAVYATRVGVQVLPSQGGVGAVVASMSCKFHRQMGYPGIVYSGVRVSRLSIGSVSLDCLIVDAVTGVAVAEGECDAVLFDYAKQTPVPIPERIRAAVEELEGKSFPI